MGVGGHHGDGFQQAHAQVVAQDHGGVAAVVAGFGCQYAGDGVYAAQAAGQVGHLVALQLDGAGEAGCFAGAGGGVQVERLVFRMFFRAHCAPPVFCTRWWPSRLCGMLALRWWKSIDFMVPCSLSRLETTCLRFQAQTGGWDVENT